MPDQDPDRKVELDHQVALADCTVPDKVRSTLFGLADPDTVDIAVAAAVVVVAAVAAVVGYWDTRFDKDGGNFDSDDCPDGLDDLDGQDSHRVGRSSRCTWKKAVVVAVVDSVAAVAAVVVADWGPEVVRADGLDSPDGHLGWLRSAADRQTDCWRRYSRRHAVEGSRGNANWDSHP